MNKQKVLELIGKPNWKAFEEFMRGQTVGMNDDKSLDYYDSDVQDFIRQTGLDKVKRKISIKEAKRLWVGD